MSSEGMTPDTPARSDRAETATFIFADLAGYTALTEAHGDEHAADAAEAFCQRARALLSEYGGEEVKTIGDAVLIRALSAEQAIRLAARLVEDSGREDRSLHVRVGMHTGTAVRRGADWFGAAVNVASRVADAARSGEVLLSDATRDAAEQARLPWQLRSRGRRQLKNVRDPVELFLLVTKALEEESMLPVDPVCRMAIDPGLASEHRVHRGIEYHFCSAECALAFRSAPRKYTDRRSRRSSLLVSDQARDRAARNLARGYARGRLTAGELEQRTEAVWSARTRADLRAATHDLPASGPRRPPAWMLPFWPIVRLDRALRRRTRDLRGGRKPPELRQ
jgi:adenylate cyclase